MTNYEFLKTYLSFRKVAAAPVRPQSSVPTQQAPVPTAPVKQPAYKFPRNGGFPSVKNLPDFDFYNINPNAKFDPTPEERALLNSIGYAEHGRYFDPNNLFNHKIAIRTKYQPMKRNADGTLWLDPTTGKPKALGSSASFWGQYTQGLAADMFKRYPKEMAQYKGYYDGVLKPMFARQLYFGKEKKRKHLDPNNYHLWQYGGIGVPHIKGQHRFSSLVPRMQNNYSGMVLTTQRLLLNELRKQGLRGRALTDAFIRRWRGANEPRYNKAVYNYMKKHHPQQTKYWGL